MKGSHKRLSAKKRLALAAAIFLAIVIALAVIFPGADKGGDMSEDPGQPGEALDSGDGIDALSGEDMSDFPFEPEDGGGMAQEPVYYGLSILLDEGMAHEAFQSVKDRLSDYCAGHPLGDGPVERVSFAQDLDHSASEDGSTETYTVQMALNGSAAMTLAIVVRGGDLESMAVDGSPIFEKA